MSSQKPHIAVLIQLAKIDGTADRTELDLIRQIGSSHNVSDQDVDDAIAEAEASDAIPSLGHLSIDDRLELLYNLVLVMKADGIIHRDEMKFCLAIVIKLDFDEEVLFDLLEHSPTEDPNGEHHEAMVTRAKGYYKG